MELCEDILRPDDMVVGAVIELFLGYNLTEVPTMLSHLDDMNSIDVGSLKNMVHQWLFDIQ